MTSTSLQALHTKVAEHIEAAYHALEVLEESDRYWRRKVRSLENRQVKSLGLTKADFDRLFHTAMSAVELGKPHEPPSLNRLGPKTPCSTPRPQTTPTPRQGPEPPSLTDLGSRHPLLQRHPSSLVRVASQPSCRSTRI